MVKADVKDPCITLIGHFDFQLCSVKAFIFIETSDSIKIVHFRKQLSNY
jgi:hypothetical protein